MTKSDLGVQISNIQLTAQKRDSSNQCVKIFWRSHGTPIISKRAAIMQHCTGFEKIYSNYIPIYIFDIKWKAECTPWRCLQIQSSQMHSSDIFWDLIQRKGGHEFSEKKTRTKHSKATLCKSKHLKGQLWPRGCNVFAYSCPAPLPGHLWPRGCNVFAYSCPKLYPGPTIQSRSAARRAA